MVDDIPVSHWNIPERDSNRMTGFIPHWEKSLRANVEGRPDPQQRFDWWISERVKRSGNWNMGVRLVFIEQPYLGWAEALVKLESVVERETRELIASDILNESD